MGCQRAAGGLHTIGGFAGKALMMLPGCAEGSGQGLTHRESLSWEKVAVML